MVRERGYPGSAKQVERYVRTVRPAARTEAYLRLDTLPGEQAQVDWGNFGQVRIGATIRLLSCFVLVLSWSRGAYARFALDQTLESFLRGHVEAFAALGGVPRVILYDNLKSVVLERVGDHIRFHPHVLEFAGHYHYAARPTSADERSCSRGLRLQHQGRQLPAAGEEKGRPARPQAQAGEVYRTGGARGGGTRRVSGGHQRRWTGTSYFGAFRTSHVGLDTQHRHLAEPAILARDQDHFLLVAAPLDVREQPKRVVLHAARLRPPSAIARNHAAAAWTRARAADGPARRPSAVGSRYRLCRVVAVVAEF
jgi:hypothetical protein